MREEYENTLTAGGPGDTVRPAHIDELNRQAWDIRRSDLRGSWKLANETERLSILSSHQKGLAESLRTLGYCLWRFGDYSQSLEKSLIALDIFRAMGDKKGEADTLNSVGAVYMYQGDNESRLECNQRCLLLRTEIGDAEGVAGSENNIGETYMEMGNLEEAEKWFARCLRNPEASIQIQSWAHHNTGIIFSRISQFEKAIASYKKSFALSESVNYEVLSVSTRLHLSKALIESGVLSGEVDEHLSKALEVSLETGIREEIHRIYLAFSELEEKRGDMEKAFDWYKKYHLAYQELFNENSNQKIKNIQVQYEIETARKEVEFERTKHIELKKLMQQIEVQKNEITDSIRYASRIQFASFTAPTYIRQHSPFDFFIFYKPKDIVSGDFYWATRKGEKFYIAVCDSTGHGVPGAFMSLLNISFLNEAINEKNITEPDLIFNYVRSRLIENLSQEEQKDGMDGVLLCIDLSARVITYAASYNEPVVAGADSVNTLMADKMPIGKGVRTEPFTRFVLDCKAGDMIYLFTDGFADQFGGPKGKKFKYKQLRRLMGECATLPLDQQSGKFDEAFETWRGNLEQVDDVTCIGLRIR